VHQRAGRFDDAVELLAEAEDWDGLLKLLRDAEVDAAMTVKSAEFGRWYGKLPLQWRGAPAGLLAAGLETQARAPVEAMAAFASAAEGFRAQDDVEAELAAIGQEGLVRWWTNDAAGLLALYPRIEALGAAGSARARALGALGSAALSHLAGDSAGVFDALRGVDDAIAANWLPTVHWFRSVAHRRDGNLQRAHDELAVAEPLGDPWDRSQLQVAQLRIDWLVGLVDAARARLAQLRDQYEQQGDRFVARELSLELAAKDAWFGEVDSARGLLATGESLLPDTASPLAHTLRLITEAAVAVDAGNEADAAAVLHDDVIATLGRPDGWYWRDRAAIALVHVLVPETRSAWEAEPLGPAHRPAIVLAEALEAARAGDLSRVKSMKWPAAGVVRAHLPVRWVVELSVAGLAAENPPPTDLLAAAGNHLRPILRSIAIGAPARLSATAKQLLSDLPAVPAYRIELSVLGPLEVRRDGTTVEHPDLRRLRVRELVCYLVARRRARREEIAEELWPGLRDGGRNLRTTLSYAQRVLQPDRGDGERPYFLRTDATWLELVPSDRLVIDVWTLEAALDDAERAEGQGSPAPALDAYRTALGLWRGEPFADVQFAVWAETTRQRLRARYTSSALRAGELWLAAGHNMEARDAAERAIHVDPWTEHAYRLLARASLADDDPSGARRAMERCRAALAELDVEPEPATTSLMARLEPGARTPG
jgi:DNA-binding SARP family transcriptional activator